MSEIPNNPNIHNYHFKEINYTTITPPVFRTIPGSDISEAARAHFNSIQRGDYHTYNTNYINPNSHGRGIRSPLDQFDIRELISINAPILGNFRVSYTNIGLYLTISAFIGLTVAFLATNYNKVIANK